MNGALKISCTIPEGGDPCESNTSFPVFWPFLLPAEAYSPSPTISLSFAAHASGLLKQKVALRVMKPVPIRRGVCRVLANLVECRAGSLHMPSATIQGGSAHSHNAPSFTTPEDYDADRPHHLPAKGFTESFPCYLTWRNVSVETGMETSRSQSRSERGEGVPVLKPLGCRSVSSSCLYFRL